MSKRDPILQIDLRTIDMDGCGVAVAVVHRDWRHGFRRYEDITPSSFARVQRVQAAIFKGRRRDE